MWLTFPSVFLIGMKGIFEKGGNDPSPLFIY